MSRVRVAVVGAGPRGLHHVQAMANVAAADVVAVCDVSASARSRAAAIVPPARLFESVPDLLDAMAADRELDAVVTAGSQEHNAAITLPLLEAGLPTLMEKPPGIYIGETRRLAAAAERSGAICMIAFNRRFNPYLAAALAAVWDRGPVVQVVAEFHKDLALLESQGRYTAAVRERVFVESPIHAVDWALYAAGDGELERVHAASRRARGRHIDGHAALVVAKSGTIIQLTAAYTTGGRLERYEIHGLGISAYLEGVEGGYVVVDGERREIELAAANDTKMQAEHFIDLVSRGAPVATPACGLPAALRAMEVVETVLAAGGAAREKATPGQAGLA